MHPERFAVKEEECSESVEKSDIEGMNSKQKQTFSQSDIQEMLQSQAQFHIFTEEIGQFRNTMLRSDIIDHCDRTRLNLSHLNVDSIGRMIKNRIEKMIKNKRIKKNWSEEDVKILSWIVSKYSDYKSFTNIEKDLHQQDWKYIASLIPGVSPDGCMFKWLSLKKNNLTEHGWSQRESLLLERTVKKYGEKDWGLVAQKLYFLNPNPHKIYRCAKQCREHWNCYLNPNLKKGPWTKEEDLQLLQIIKKNNCQKKWAEMVGHFKGRTQNALKNRFTLIIEKQMKSHPKNKKLTEMELIEEYLEKSYVQQFVETTPKKQFQNDERMKTRRRQNINTATPVKVQINLDNENTIKENLSCQGFDNPKSNEKFSSEQLPNVENFQIVTLQSGQIRELTEMIRREKSEYVPCTFKNNQLKRIFKL